mgnify:CR=1 FL=1
MNMTEILKSAVERGASDIFVVAGLPLTYKVRGEQQRETAGRRLSRPKRPKRSRRKSIVLPRVSRTA